MDYKQIIAASVSDVFTTMLMLEVSPGDRGSETLLSMPAGVSGMLGFSGEVSGMLTIHCPSEVAIGITSNFLGMDVEEINEDVKDAIGELVNMVTGGLKDALGQSGQDIKLAIPTTIAGRSFRISAKSDVGRVCLPFETTSGTFFVELQYK